MIPYIGDLSTKDASVLRMLAGESNSILEFGVGASTQILRHYSCGGMTSVDTSDEWIDRTKENFNLVGVKGEVDFRLYGSRAAGKYDLIFVDGIKKFRKEFAVNHWRYLSFGGKMAFHDTRKGFHIGYVSEIIQEFFTQIDIAEMNVAESNITTIKKRRRLNYVNWNSDEGRKSWQYGRGEFNMREFLQYKNNMEKQ